MDSTNVPLRVALPTGIVSGTLGSLCGIGGGVVVIPALTQFTGMSPHAVSASSLFVVSASSSLAAASYLEQGFPNLPLALTLMSTSVPGAALGARLVSHLRPSVLKKITGLIMLASAPAIWLKGTPTNGEGGIESEAAEETVEQISARNRFRVIDLAALGPTSAAKFLRSHIDFVILGIVTGFASGVIGIGGGLVMNTYMALYTDMPQHEIVATSLVVAVPIGLSGTLVHLRAGRVNPKACTAVAASALVACGVASRVMRDFEDSNLKKLFTCVLVGSALSMLR